MTASARPVTARSRASAWSPARPNRTVGVRLGAVSGLGLGVAVLWLSLLVLLPLAAVVVKARAADGRFLGRAHQSRRRFRRCG